MSILKMGTRSRINIPESSTINCCDAGSDGLVFISPFDFLILPLSLGEMIRRGTTRLITLGIKTILDIKLNMNQNRKIPLVLLQNDLLPEAQKRGKQMALNGAKF